MKSSIIMVINHCVLMTYFQKEFRRRNREAKTRPYTKENNMYMYRDILRFAERHSISFKFTDLGNWLLKNNNEFLDEFSTFPGFHTPKSRRLANKNHRIHRCIEALVRFGLLQKKSIVQSDRNESLYTLTYYLTPSGRLLIGLLTWLTYTETNQIDEDIRVSKLREAETNILAAVEMLLQVKDSFLLAFICAFFRKCVEKKFFGILINYFLTKIVQSERIDDGQKLLRLFLGLDMW
jgi:hypothetical protein